jgi:hypothetical protein
LVPLHKPELIIFTMSFNVFFRPELPEESGNVKLPESITTQVFLISS